MPFRKEGNRRYVPEASLRNITTRWKGLRWAMPSKVFIAPLLKTTLPKNPCDYKGCTFQSTRCTSPPSKLAQSERERERERERGREGGRQGGRRRGKHGRNSKIPNQRGVLRLQASLCKASGREREREKEGQAWQEFQSTRCTSSPSMSRIPINEVYFVSINEVYFVSKHVKTVTP